MVERRLPKPKVAGSNPVFRSIKFPQNHRPQHSTCGLFLYRLPHSSGKRGSPQDLLHPPVEGRGGYKKARNTRADFDPEGREISASSNPVFRSKKVSKEPPTAAPEQKTTLTDIPNENKIPHLPKVCIFPAISPHLPKVSFRTMSTRASVAAFCLHSAFPHLPKVSRNTRKSTHLPKVEQQQSPPTPNISLLSAGFRTFAALWQTIISKEDTTNTWNGRPQPRKRSGQPGRSGSTPTGSIWQKQPSSPKTVQNLK